MKSITVILKVLGPATLVVAIASCGGGDGGSPSVEIPALIGKRVMFNAESDNSNMANMADEVYVTDTGYAVPTAVRIDQMVDNHHTSQLFALGTTGDLAYVVSKGSTNCDDELHFVPRAGGMTRNTLGGVCLFKLRASPSGLRLALLFTSSSMSVFGVSDPPVTAINQLNMGAPQDFEMSGDGQIVYWTDNNQIWSADLAGAVPETTRQLVSTNTPVALMPTSDGAAVVYYTGLLDRLRVATLNGSSDIPLTAQLTGGTLIVEAAVSPNDAYALFAVTPTAGPDQLWFVPLGAPLTEQRVDVGAAAYAGQPGFPNNFVFSPDGTRFAWIGDAGSGLQVFVTAAAAPTVATALTPPSAGISQLLWTDNSTLAYINFVGGTGYAVRSVSINDPLNTVTLGPVEGAGSNPYDLTTCSDGTLVFASFTMSGANKLDALYKATALAGGSVVQIAPTLTNAQRPFSEIACVD